MLTTEFMQSAGLMVLVLAWSVVLCRSDWRQRKLPNAWTMGAAVVILVFRLGYGGIPFFLNGVAAALLAGAFLFIPFLMRGAGAGDLKMLFACGALVGMGNGGTKRLRRHRFHHQGFQPLGQQIVLKAWQFDQPATQFVVNGLSDFTAGGIGIGGGAG